MNRKKRLEPIRKKGIALLLVSCFLFPCAAAQTERAALIPLPRELSWKNEAFDISRAAAVYISSDSLEPLLAQFLPAGLKQLPVKKTVPGRLADRSVYIALENVQEPACPEEGYRLTVSAANILLKANTLHGIFNGLQTLVQLLKGNKIAGCDVSDYPAFSWRGYMVDVGRNFQSVDQLKQQIDMMARYKMNVFHFHLTEHAAWRLQVKRYPQLTSAAHMTRDKGRFYTVEAIKELITYCRQRFITLVPEIDMPGHSDAFTRATGYNMQTPEGLEIVKNILREVGTEYDVPYIHIGADEVAITNKQFVPQVEALLDSLGKKVIAWNPGESKNPQTIQHLWKAEDQHYKTDTGGRYIDSRFLYISDMDPENAVVTIFNRKFFEKDRGDQRLLGAEFCLWSDRRVTHQDDLLRYNAVYPSLLAFAERSWKGGGYDGYNFFIGAAGSERATAFKAFEQRLLVHKQKYFSLLPFQYVKQTQIRWKLLGPFPNSGNLEQSFWPEERPDSIQQVRGISATGGTVWLWHTHFPVTAAWLPHPQEYTTWYASTRFRSPVSGTFDFWIDTKDQSKSGADATPPKGSWDYNKSRIWINGQLITPPAFKFAGRKSGLLEDPLVDEMYYIRPPHKITVSKGWNTVLVKLPVDAFDPLKDWQVPPKLMFTVIPLEGAQQLNRNAVPWVFDPDAD
ncbi:family 20 glycosylhydrolase [Niabella beijingensis]|uniref:family 20 glycosylhydrolase n=1 Tax=Niabella beijingensis TaxID=2872700 RepID=UPI001CBBFF59|nr:family 20 glycosylhydrolase [Niabella beijingensis]MBZ4190726.1 beta-N-acetylhexosaminidase [Niabella beijingensis]